MGQRVDVGGEANRLGKPERKRVLTGRPVVGIRPETCRSTHDQGEGGVIPTGGPNSLPLQR